MLRRVGFTEPIEAPLDDIVDTGIMALHYLNGTLADIDPFNQQRVWRADRWWPVSDARVWTYDEGDGKPLPDIVWFEPHTVKANDGKRQRCALGQNHPLCVQLAGSGFNTSGYPMDDEYSGGGTEAMNYDERLASDGDTLVIMPLSAMEAPSMHAIPSYWGSPMNEMMAHTRSLCLRHNASVENHPDALYEHWSWNPAVGATPHSSWNDVWLMMLRDGRHAPTVEQCKEAKHRWLARWGWKYPWCRMSGIEMPSD